MEAADAADVAVEVGEAIELARAEPGRQRTDAPIDMRRAAYLKTT